MSMIAKETQITKSSIYSYFKSKEELYIAVLDYLVRFQTEYWAQKKRGLKKASTKKALHDILFQVNHTTTKVSALSVFWQTALVAPPVPLKDQVNVKLKGTRDMLLQFLVEIIEQGIQTNQIKTSHKPLYLAHTYYSLLISCTISQVYDSVPDKNECLETMFELFWDGIKNE